MARYEFSGLHHAAFATNDMDQTIRYWRDLLGFKIVLGLGTNKERQYAFQISKQMLIVFFEWPEVERVKPKRHGGAVKGPFIFDHLALNMKSLHDLKKLQDQLVCSELPVSDIIDHGFINSIYTFDPNGIPLEFNIVVESVDLDIKPVFVDPSPAKFIKEGLEPCEHKWPTCEDEDEECPRVILPGSEKKYFI